MQKAAGAQFVLVVLLLIHVDLEAHRTPGLFPVTLQGQDDGQVSHFSSVNS
jgi:hypothetical protein